MTDEAIIGILKDALGDVAPEVRAALTMKSTLSDLGIDSIVAIELAGSVEDTLGIRFADDRLARVDSVKDLVELIRQSIAQKGVES